MGAFIAVATLDQIPEGGNRAFEVGGRSILLCRARSGVYAVANKCSHAEAALEGGIMKGIHLFCPLHAARFDLRDGSTNGSLTREPIRTFPVQVSDGTISIDPEN